MNITGLRDKSKHLIPSCSNEGLSREQLGSAGTDSQPANSDEKQVTASVGFWCELHRWRNLQMELGFILALFVPAFVSL